MGKNNTSARRDNQRFDNPTKVKPFPDTKIYGDDPSLLTSPTSTISMDSEAISHGMSDTHDLQAISNTTIDIVQAAIAALTMHATRLSDLAPALEAEKQVSSFVIFGFLCRQTDIIREQLEVLSNALNDREQRQVERVSRLKADIIEQQKEIKEALRHAVAQIIQAKVESEIKGLVRQHVSNLHLHFSFQRLKFARTSLTSKFLEICEMILQITGRRLIKSNWTCIIRKSVNYSAGFKLKSVRYTGKQGETTLLPSDEEIHNTRSSKSCTDQTMNLRLPHYSPRPSRNYALSLTLISRRS